jgi:mannose-6-phosphate isomerase class I
VSGPFFEVTLHEIAGTGYSVRFPAYELCTVTDGTGSLQFGNQAHPLEAGDHLVLPADAGEVRLDGTLTLVSSRPVLRGDA